MINDWRDNQIYWSCLQYARSWISSDGIRVKAIESAQGLMPDMIRPIAIEYNINRGIIKKTTDPNKKSKKIDIAAKNLAELINESASNWPNCLIKRAEFCVNVAERGKNHCFHKFQGSAATKFMWFMKPNGWTMYDQYAAKGLGIAHYGNSPTKLKLFYITLQSRDFPMLVESMQEIINDSSIPSLPATRIIDTMLMARGGRGGDKKAIDDCKCYLSLMPLAAAKSIITLAETLQKKFGNDQLASTNVRNIDQ